MKENLVYDGFHQIIEMEAIVNGRKVKREKVIFKSAVAGLVYDTNNRIALVEQFRPPVGSYTLEIPAGILDKELTPKEILLEELEEECSIESKDVLSVSENPIHEYYMVIGSSPALLSLYAVQVTPQPEKVINDADVESIRWVTLDEMKKLIDDNNILDPKTIIAFYYMMKIIE